MVGKWNFSKMKTKKSELTKRKKLKQKIYPPKFCTNSYFIIFFHNVQRNRFFNSYMKEKGVADIIDNTLEKKIIENI